MTPKVLYYDCQYSQQTRYIDSMLAQCWATVCEAITTLSQHIINVLCLLGCLLLPQYKRQRDSLASIFLIDFEVTFLHLSYFG